MESSKSILKPDFYVESLACVDVDALYRQGIRLLLLDIDNTLSKHGSITGGDYAVEQVARIHRTGMECIIISNAMYKRAETFADSLGIPFLPKARKPSRRGIRLAMQRHPELDRSQIAIIGDQLLTDILAGNRANILTILVDPISAMESKQVRMKRPIEKLLKKICHIERNDLSIHQKKD